jgi:hypothetical protein
MTEDLTQRAARHRPYQPKGEWELETPKPRCIWDEQPWPCDAHQFYDGWELTRSAFYSEVGKRVAAEEQVRGLAAALAAEKAARARAEATLILVRDNLNLTPEMEKLVSIIDATLGADDTAVAALQTMLEASEAEAEALFHNFDGSCNCRMCTVLIPMMRTALSGEDKR